MAQSVRKTVQQVKPILSLDKDEARKRVLNLYKAWFRQLPYIVKQYDMPKSVEHCRQKLRGEFTKHGDINDYDMPKSVEHCRQKLRGEFTKHGDINDVRVVDMLIIKGQMELKETVNMWKQKGHMMSYFKDTWEPKPKDFLSKFISGKE